MLNNSDSDRLIRDNTKSPYGLEDELMVPGDLEGFCNIVSYIWSFEGRTYRSICDN